MAGVDRLRAGGARPGARADPAAGRPHRLRSSRPRRIPGAPRPSGLYRRLPARIAARRRQRFPHRRRPRGQGARCADHPVSGRELRLRLQLARRRWTEEPAADGARARVEFARDQPVRHQRVRRLVPRRRDRAAAGDEFRHRHRGDGGGLRRVPATSNAARSGAICAGRTATSSRTTCATGVSATRWTVPGRSARCSRASTGARRATRRSRCASSIRRAADCLRLERHRDAAPTWSGTAKCSRNATTWSMGSRSTPTTATRSR